MIDFAGIVSKITGRGAPDQAATMQPGTTDADAGASGAFAALVQLAAQVDADATQGKLRLVVDNSALPPLPTLPAVSTSSSEPMLPTLPSAPVGVADGQLPALPAAPAGLAPERPDQPGVTPQTLAPLSTAEHLAQKAARLPADPALAASIPVDLVDHGETEPPSATKTGGDEESAEATPILNPIDSGATAAAIAVAAPPVIIQTVARPAAEAFAPRSAPSAPSPVMVSGGAAEPVPDKMLANAAPVTPAIQSDAGRQPEAVSAPQSFPGANTLIKPTPTEAPEPVTAAAAQALTALADMAAGGAPAVPTRARSASTAKADTAIPATATAIAARVSAPGLDEGLEPVATTRARSEGSTFAMAGDTAQANAPLRAIFDGLPPMVQSELSTRPVSVVTGPATAQALGEQVIDMGVSGQWIDRLAQEIAGLAEGSGHSRFTLNPPHLGRLQVDLWQGDNATNVRLTAETDEAAQRLAEGRHSLATDARVAALSLGTITVEKASASAEQRHDERQNGRNGQSGDLSGQAQQNSQGQAQARSGGDSNGNGAQDHGRARRSTPNQTNEASDASARVSAQRSADGRVRFA